MFVGISQKISPIKYGFLIHPDSLSDLKSYTQIAFSLWGGMYSPIIPIYENLPDMIKTKYGITLDSFHYYNGILENFSPDVIIFDDNLNEEFIKLLHKDSEFIKFSEFSSSLVTNQNRFGIGLIQIIEDLVENEFKYKRSDNLNISIPNVNPSNLFLNILFGSVSENTIGSINERVGKVDFITTPLLNNFDDILKFQDSISIIKLNTYKLNSYLKKPWRRGTFIYFIDGENLEDLLNFWNLRALGCNIIPIPLAEINSKYFNDYLRRFCSFTKSKKNGSNIINYIKGFNIKLDNTNLGVIGSKLNEIQIEIKDINFAFQSWFPRYWEETRVLEADHVLCSTFEVDSKYEQIKSKEGVLEFDTIDIPFNISKRDNKDKLCKIIFHFNYHDNELIYAETIFGIDSDDWLELTFLFQREKWKISKNGIEFFTSDIKERIFIVLPKSLAFFKKYFSKKKYRVSETPNGRLAQEVFNNLGGIMGLNLFSNGYTHKIIESFENGSILNFNQLTVEIKRQSKDNKNDKTRLIIKELLDAKILEFGSCVKCPFCNQKSFYLLKDLENNMACGVCRNNFNLEVHNPNSIEWAYRGIGPFSKNNKVGGVLCVFLTLKLFKREFADIRGTISSLMEFEITKGNNTKEIDLAILLNSKNEDERPPDLILCECKTFKKLEMKDIDRLKSLGEDFPNAILAFCTLNDKLSEEERILLIELVNHFRKGFGSRPQNPVLILTSRDLMVNLYFNDYFDELRPYHKYNDYIGTICEFSVVKHLGLKSWDEIQSEEILSQIVKINAPDIKA